MRCGARGRRDLSTCDLLVHNGRLATLVPGSDPYGSVDDGVVAISGTEIRWAGRAADAPAELVEAPRDTLDVAGGWVTPGLIDAHTHLVYGGNRADEFARRLAGESYEEIARAGGGILSTVRATREATDEELFAGAAGRADALIDQGVTTVEIKSGYGLDVTTELRMLRVARALGETRPITVRTTLLAAHALPPEFVRDRTGYLDLVCSELVPEAAAGGWADQVDAFCETIAFTPDECRRVLEAGARHGLGGRLHADQLTDGGGARLAAELGAFSADHLDFTAVEAAVAMAEAGTVAGLLPGAFHFLKPERVPPVEAFRSAGVPMLVATDHNPGSSPVLSPLVAMNLACVHFGLTPAEALLGMTRVAARVLDLSDRVGVIAADHRADLAVWDVGDPAELPYWLGANPCRAVVQGGRVVRRTPTG